MNILVSPSVSFTNPFSSATDSSTLQEVVPTAIILPPFFFVLFILFEFAYLVAGSISENGLFKKS